MAIDIYALSSVDVAGEEILPNGQQVNRTFNPVTNENTIEITGQFANGSETNLLISNIYKTNQTKLGTLRIHKQLEMSGVAEESLHQIKSDGFMVIVTSNVICRILNMD